MVENSLGISMPASGITNMEVQLEENSEGFFGLSPNSPAIDAAVSGFKPLPQFEGMEEVDTAISFDLMGQPRPSSIAEKDLGCNEFPHEVFIQPFATEENTGPIYNTSVVTTTENNVLIVEDLIQINPKPVANQLYIRINSPEKIDLQVVLFNMEGRNLATITTQENFSGETTITRNIVDLPAGAYTIRAIGHKSQKQVALLLSLIHISEPTRPY